MAKEFSDDIVAAVIAKAAVLQVILKEKGQETVNRRIKALTTLEVAPSPDKRARSK